MLVITKPLTTSDIDHAIPTEPIINMTGSYNKEKEAVLFQSRSPGCALRVVDAEWGKTLLLFYQRCSSVLKVNIFYSFLFLITHTLSPCCCQACAFQKGCVAQGLGMIS